MEKSLYLYWIMLPWSLNTIAQTQTYGSFSCLPLKRNLLCCSYTGWLSVRVCFLSISPLFTVLKFLPIPFRYHEDYFLSFTQPNPLVPLMFSSECKFSEEPFRTPNPQTTLLMSWCISCFIEFMSAAWISA